MTTNFKFILSITLSLVSGLASCSSDSDEEMNVSFVLPNNTVIPQNKTHNNIDENLLKNGGLEEWSSFWTPEMPKHWSLPSNEFVKRNKTIVFEEFFSAKMQSEESGKTARLEQVIKVTPNEKIRIRFHYYVEQWKSKGARTYCYFRTRAAESSNISSEELKSFYGQNNYYIIRGGGYGLTYLPHNLNVWKTFDETIEVPPTATYFAFGINSYYGTTIYIDNCWICSENSGTTSIDPVRM